MFSPRINLVAGVSIFFVLAMLFYGCTGNLPDLANQYQIPQPDTLQFSPAIHTFAGDSVTGNEYVSIEMPEVISADPRLKKRAEHLIESLVKTQLRWNTTNIHSETAPNSLQNYAMRFLQDCHAAKQFFVDDSAAVCTLDVRVRVIFNTSKFFTVELNTQSSADSPDRLHTPIYAVYSVPSLKKIALDDIIANPDEFELFSEILFRNQNDIAPTESLNKAGYSFPENRFSLPNNFAMLQKGMLFSSNPDETAPNTYRNKRLFIEWKVLLPYIRRPLGQLEE